MPGHDHSIVRHMVAGDLNTKEALWLWNCPITREELDIWHHVNEYVLAFYYNQFFSHLSHLFVINTLLSIHTLFFPEPLIRLRLLRRVGYKTRTTWEKG